MLIEGSKVGGNWTRFWTSVDTLNKQQSFKTNCQDIMTIRVDDVGEKCKS